MKNLLIFLVLSVIIFVLFFPTISRRQKLVRQNEELLNRIHELKDEQEDLIEEKRKLEDDLEYLERVAREKMGLVRDGEIMLKIEGADEWFLTKDVGWGVKDEKDSGFRSP